MAAANPFVGHPDTPITAALSMAAITPDNSNDLPTLVRLIYVGTTGNVQTIDSAGNTTVHKNVPSGSYLGPFRVARVTVTNTTATDMIGYV